ncbi:major capsid protein [Senegalia massiliensis]|uniref:Phage capsid protein n=1 Tax=Senegalia massiliensis TaxID=1720316 RepID=A0A845QYM6_9CLOT|nr:major capsid protein [Senegalia massiliensis]NBI08067.1 phage capsid protein [Senegalia massiliensis]
MTLSIYDYIKAKEIGTYYNASKDNKTEYFGQSLFPRKKQLGLDLRWIKGSKGVPVVLKASAFDAKSDIRDRIGIQEIQTEMPFFKESMLVKEKDRQELNKIIASGNQDYIDLILTKIFDDTTTLLDGAEAQEERMRMQLLSDGKISAVSDGVIYDYDYKFNSNHKEALISTAMWSDLESSNPVADIQRWKDVIIDDTGVEPTKAICTRKVWNYLMNNKKIKLDMNPAGGQNIIMTDKMLVQYLESKLNVTITVYNRRYAEGGETKQFFPDDKFTLYPDKNLGNTYFGTTPEESDLMTSNKAEVSIVNKGMAITTTEETDPVNVSTKVSMITLPSFENIDEVFIATVHQ